MKKSFLTLFTICILGISYLNAHGIYALLRESKIQIAMGEGPSDEAYDPSIIKNIAGYDSAETLKSVKLLPKDNYAELDPEDGVEVVAFSAQAYWSKLKDGTWKQGSKDELSDVESAMEAIQNSVSYINQKKMLNKKQDIKLIKNPKPHKDFMLEILPATDPRALKMGDTLKIKVLKEGKPFAGAEVIVDLIGDVKHTVKTDKFGIASIKVRNDGLNVLAVHTQFTPKDKSKVDITRVFSTLAFTIFH